MDKAKAMELANKILNANKKDASFFDFINEQFQDDSAIVSFIEQIDLMLEQNYNPEMTEIKYILVSIIKDNNIRDRIHKPIRRFNWRRKRTNFR